MDSQKPTEEKPADTTDKPGWAEKYLPLIGAAIPPALSFLSNFTHEDVFFVISIGLAIFFLLVIILSWYAPFFTRPSKIVGADAVPFETPIFRGWKLKCLYLAFVAVVLLPTLYYDNRNVLVPMATIVRFERSNIRYFKKDPESRFNSRTMPSLDFLTRKYKDKNGEDAWEYETATHCTIMTISRTSGFRSKSITIESVEFKVEHIPHLEVNRRKGVYPLNVVLPIRYSAILTPKSDIVKATILDLDGNPTDGNFILDEENKSADIHIAFTGTIGLYRLRPIITISNDTRRNPTKIEHKETEFVGLADVD